MNNALLSRLAPAVFVFLWSTGWIVARYSADYADALTFLTIRFACAGALLAAAALAARAQWPQSPRAFGHAFVAGALLHGVYLGCVWWAIRRGLPASLSALIAASQPLATAFLAPRLLGEASSPRRWVGVAVGFGGLLLVLWPRLASAGAASTGLIAINFIGMAGATAGFFYQKHFVPAGDLRTGAAVQYVGALALVLPAAWLLEPMHVEWNLTMALVLGWSVIVVSSGAIALLLFMIRQGEVSGASQLIFLVSPAAALEAFALFGERLSLWQILGMAATAGGVALARQR